MLGSGAASLSCRGNGGQHTEEPAAGFEPARQPGVWKRSPDVVRHPLWRSVLYRCLLT